MVFSAEKGVLGRMGQTRRSTEVVAWIGMVKVRFIRGVVAAAQSTLALDSKTISAGHGVAEVGDGAGVVMDLMMSGGHTYGAKDRPHVRGPCWTVF